VKLRIAERYFYGVKDDFEEITASEQKTTILQWLRDRRQRHRLPPPASCQSGIQARYRLPVVENGALCKNDELKYPRKILRISLSGAFVDVTSY